MNRFKRSVIITFLLLGFSAGCDSKTESEKQLLALDTSLIHLKEQIGHEMLANQKVISDLCDTIRKQKQSQDSWTDFLEICEREAYLYSAKMINLQQRVDIVKQVIAVSSQPEKNADIKNEIMRLQKGLAPEVYNASWLDWIQMLTEINQGKSQHPARYMVGNFRYGDWIVSNNGSYRWYWNKAYLALNTVDSGPYYFHRWKKEGEVTYYTSIELPTISPRSYQEKIIFLEQEEAKRKK
ncbi:MAG: hypothetical protein IPP74_01155 [Alphaproteobacteria bacterium]|nr:hypothetical protein [Alphaproteobacteria bacterium]